MTNFNPPRDFKGIWIPKDIWIHPDLSWMEKCLAAEIDSLDGDDGCFASNEYLMNLFGLKESTVRNAIAKLKKLNLVKQIRYDGRIRYLRGYSRLRNSGQTAEEIAVRPATDSQTAENPAVTPAEIQRSRTKNIHIRENKDERKDKTTPTPSKGNGVSFVFYGEDKLVKLTDDQYRKHKDLMGEENLKKLIDELNDYLASSGKRYKSHFHTLRQWYRKRQENPPEKSQKAPRHATSDKFIPQAPLSKVFTYDEQEEQRKQLSNTLSYVPQENYMWKGDILEIKVDGMWRPINSKDPEFNKKLAAAVSEGGYLPWKKR